MADEARDRSATAPGAPDADGVRVIAKRSRIEWSLVAAAGVAAGLAAVTIGLTTMQREPAADTSSTPRVVSANAVDEPRPAAAFTTDAPIAVDRGRAAADTAALAALNLPTTPADWTSGDPNDLASWFQPGDPAPTMREVIETLNEMGIRTGLGAFNPPGTSPPLVGLAVPPDFPLPPGYVRHHQVTDDGVPIEAILMFAPDVVLRDADGHVVPLPEDRVVPPEFAPPGLPIRRVTIPTP
jgi:hypothetical protein